MHRRPPGIMSKIIHLSLVAVVLSGLISTIPWHGINHVTAASTAPLTQYDDPYSDFRDAKYSNARLLSERDEIKLGTELHREVTKKFNLTDAGLDRVNRLGQRCAVASLRPNITYRFHVIQDREINGFSLPGGHV